MKDAINYHLSQGPIYGTKWHSRFEKKIVCSKKHTCQNIYLFYWWKITQYYKTEFISRKKSLQDFLLVFPLKIIENGNEEPVILSKNSATFRIFSVNNYNLLLFSNDFYYQTTHNISIKSNQNV